MSFKDARWRYSWMFGLKVGGGAGIVLALVTDFLFPLAPMGMWCFLVSVTILAVTGIVVALQPDEMKVEVNSFWFAPFGRSLFVFFLITLVGYISSEMAVGDMGYLSGMFPSIAGMQDSLGLAPRR